MLSWPAAWQCAGGRSLTKPAVQCRQHMSLGHDAWIRGKLVAAGLTSGSHPWAEPLHCSHFSNIGLPGP